MGSNALLKEVRQAAKQAQIDEYIMSLPQSYETKVGSFGTRFSVGERQRLSVVRAMLKNVPILLLDEATASLDIENELAVKNAIRNLLKRKKTVVMIAHTLSIVQHAGRIAVVSGGCIVEQGNHEVLLRNNEKYAAMWFAEQKRLL